MIFITNISKRCNSAKSVGGVRVLIFALFIFVQDS